MHSLTLERVCSREPTGNNRLFPILSQFYADACQDKGMRASRKGSVSTGPCETGGVGADDQRLGLLFPLP